MQRILAITWLTWKSALRFKLFLVIAALLLLSVIALPILIKDDGTAQGFTQIILTYTLSTITALLGLSTLWLACGTLARDIEECQIQLLVTKPVARWQIWIGKWIGIMTLNATLLGLSGGCVYGLLIWRAAHLPAPIQAELREQVLVARASVREANLDAEIQAETQRIATDRLKTSTDENLDKAEFIRQIREGVKADYQLVPPSYQRVWKIDLGFAKNSLTDKPLQLRIKFNVAQKSASGTYNGILQVGVPPKLARQEATTMAADTFHEFTIPPNFFDANGVLTITFINPNQTALLFPLDEGLEVLYPESSFTINFVRGLGIIFCWMGLLAALGLMAASFLTFPVAAFFSLAMLLVVFSSSTLAETVDSGSVAAGDEEKGIAGHSVLDVVLIPAFKQMLMVIDLVKHYSPIDDLSSGHSITWGQLGTAFCVIVLGIGGVFSLLGIYLFHRRELATAQSTQ